MSVPVFLSYPNPYLERQQVFIDKLKKHLKSRGLEPRTVGVTDYDIEPPLDTIRRLMLKSNGIITIAFRRAYIQSGTGRPNSDIGGKQYDLAGQWLTSPFCQIEPAMAYQLGLPLLVLREKGVIADGILERGVFGAYLPEFDLDSDVDYFNTLEWAQIIRKWETRVFRVVENKDYPPRLY